MWEFVLLKVRKSLADSGSSPTFTGRRLTVENNVTPSLNFRTTYCPRSAASNTSYSGDKRRGSPAPGERFSPFRTLHQFTNFTVTKAAYLERRPLST
jgi:hypothetical protein